MYWSLKHIKKLSRIQRHFGVRARNYDAFRIFFLRRQHEARLRAVRGLVFRGGRAFPSKKNILRSDNKEALHNAVKEGNLDEVEKTITAGADVNAFFEAQSGMTPLLEIAIQHACKEYTPVRFLIVQMLLDNKANINTQDRFGVTPLHEAVLSEMSEYPVIARMLLARGANPMLCTKKEDETPLHWAVKAVRDKKILKKQIGVLLHYGAGINAQTNEGDTPLMTAITYRQDDDILKQLILSGADPSIQNKNEETVFELEKMTPTKRNVIENTVAERDLPFKQSIVEVFLPKALRDLALEYDFFDHNPDKN